MSARELQATETNCELTESIKAEEVVKSTLQQLEKQREYKTPTKIR